MSTTREAAKTGVGIETAGLDTILEEDRHGRPRDLFWPWFAANISVLALGYGAFVLEDGVSFWQVVIVSVIGIMASSALCGGVVALAGKRGSAPTMVLSRAAFGVNGNRLPAILAWILTAGCSVAWPSELGQRRLVQRCGPKSEDVGFLVGIVGVH